MRDFESIHQATARRNGTPAVERGELADWQSTSDPFGVGDHEFGVERAQGTPSPLLESILYFRAFWAIGEAVWEERSRALDGVPDRA